jgi:hypothetical protein
VKRALDLVAAAGTRSGLRWLRWLRWLRVAVSALVVLGCVGFILVGANSPADPYLTHHYLPGTGPPGAAHRAPSHPASHP